MVASGVVRRLPGGWHSRQALPQYALNEAGITSSGAAFPSSVLVLDMVSQVRHRIVDRTAEQILAVVKFCEGHTSSLNVLA